MDRLDICRDLERLKQAAAEIGDYELAKRIDAAIPPTGKCLKCGKQFTYLRKGRGKFCRSSCRAAYHNENKATGILIRTMGG